MINIQSAYNIALKEATAQYANAEIINCIDIGDHFAFAIGINKEPLIGAPTLTVDKKTSELDSLSIPPIENLTRLKNGTKVDISHLLKSE
jgi:hypothetical protein